MDGEEDYSQMEESGCNNLFSTFSRNTTTDSAVEERETSVISGSEKQGDLGDMTFCMANYIKEAMKMMFMMRSHHMLTDVILEVGQELFHAHKVILAAASPYFKVSIKFYFPIAFSNKIIY